jgi:hypothetical protein
MTYRQLTFRWWGLMRAQSILMITMRQSSMTLTLFSWWVKMVENTCNDWFEDCATAFDDSDEIQTEFDKIKILDLSDQIPSVSTSPT